MKDDDVTLPEREVQQISQRCQKVFSEVDAQDTSLCAFFQD